VNEDDYRKREAELYDQIYDLDFELAGVRVELEQQAVLNGKGAERELALRAKVETLERTNAQLMPIVEAAKAYVDYEIEGESTLWPEANQKFEALKAAVEARKEQP
jgi:hypothetical protein